MKYTFQENASYERIVRNGNLETKYSPDDFVNPEWFEPESTGHGRGRGEQKAYIVLNGGFVIGIVFAEYHSYCEQDALDQLVDSGKMDGLMCDETELKDYQVGTDSDGNPEYEGISWLGNASEPFADESLDMWVMGAREFAEELCLMTHGRVMARLEERVDCAERRYKAIAVESPEWTAAYSDKIDAKDAQTLARLIGDGRGVRG